jgi:hypothetical protein
MAKYQQLMSDAPVRIFRVAEAQTVDASKRLDRLVEAEIDQAKSDRSIATVFLLIFTAASIVFFAVGSPIAGAARYPRSGHRQDDVDHTYPEVTGASFAQRR